ncbi:hydrolase [Oceanobacillus chungangensis]|uniref:Hydrolase n=1 Tax=Oceanobacillus chungangensis TaxID=1229152 RepID=A0A3D8PNB3_9BACI|nr:hydrolase [Oceanobacillus chungangensis]
MLATDLDGTLVGDPTALKELIGYYEGLPYEVNLVYITGRYRSSALSLIQSEGLPKPTVLVTDVGTSIYTGSEMDLDKEWEGMMKRNWEPEAIREVASRFPSISLQQLPDDRRVSFEVKDDPEAVEDFKLALDEAGITHKFIYSSGRDIDILPKGSGKGQALHYVVEKYAGIETKILVAGDSGNDLDMLTLGYPSVIVANAQKELAECKENPKIFHATKDCAGGIHEAWLHFYGEMAKQF